MRLQKYINCHIHFVGYYSTKLIHIPDTLHIECNTTGIYPTVTQWLENNGGALATDECNAISWTNNYSLIDCNDSFKIVEFSASDECGNSTSATGVIVVTNTTTTTQVPSNQGFKFITASPNPFLDKVKLSFNLEKPTKLNITFLNKEGKILKIITQQFPAGINDIKVSKQELKMIDNIYFFIEGTSIYHYGQLLIIN